GESSQLVKSGDQSGRRCTLFADRSRSSARAGVHQGYRDLQLRSAPIDRWTFRQQRYESANSACLAPAILVRHESLPEWIRRACHLQGTFTLLLEEIARDMLPLIAAETEVLAARELGGIPIATILSHFTNLPSRSFAKRRNRIVRLAWPKEPM